MVSGAYRRSAFHLFYLAEINLTIADVLPTQVAEEDADSPYP
jgi:hypothetical protein